MRLKLPYTLIKLIRGILDAPNLYKLKIQLFAEGKLKDEYTTVFGFRSITVENRYVLNGEPTWLMGQNGCQVPIWSVEWLKQLLHFERNPFIEGMPIVFLHVFIGSKMKPFLDWCDRNGILVQEEIPLIGVVLQMINDEAL